jgi:hypothetical protein
VFLSLAVGIILGVAISGKVRGAEDALNAQRVAELEGELERQRELASEDTGRLDALETYVERTYTPLMAERLAGESTAVVLLGPVSEGLRSAIEAALRDSGGVSARVVALDLPLDAERVDSLLAGDEDLAGLSGDDLAPLGERLGQELVEGIGEEPLLPSVAEELVAELEGSTTVEATGVVVARSQEPVGEQAAGERRATETYLDGLMRGLRGTGAPVVGVTSSESESREALLDWFQSSGLSSVDHVDFESGRLALTLLLAGAPPGSYGFLPEVSPDGPIPPVPTEPSGE